MPKTNNLCQPRASANVCKPLSTRHNTRCVPMPRPSIRIAQPMRTYSITHTDRQPKPRVRVPHYTSMLRFHTHRPINRDRNYVCACVYVRDVRRGANNGARAELFKAVRAREHAYSNTCLAFPYRGMRAYGTSARALQPFISVLRCRCVFPSSFSLWRSRVLCAVLSLAARAAAVTICKPCAYPRCQAYARHTSCAPPTNQAQNPIIE